MCQRFSFSISREKLKRQFSLNIKAAELQYSYNIAVGQNAYIVDNQSNELKIMRWGFLPYWAKDEQIGLNYANAAAESISTQDSFRMAVRRQRCLVFADSFYEWRRQGRQSQPYRVLLEDNGILVFAGLWCEWQNEKNETQQRFTILTTQANAEMRLFGTRMPVILKTANEQQVWLSDAPLATILDMLKPLNDSALRYYPVAKEIENLDVNYPEIHRQAELSEEEIEFWKNY